MLIYLLTRRCNLRRLGLRTGQPLGTDILGNTYYMFSAAQQKLEGWGAWVVCHKYEALVSPLGTDEGIEAVAKIPKARTTRAKSSVPTEERIENNNWYMVEGGAAVCDLAAWIRYKA